MRLLDTQRQAIKAIVTEIVGPDSQVWLFGSRTDDTKKGGDIDLLISTEKIISNRVSVLCKLEGRFATVFGNRKIDVLLKDARPLSDIPIFTVATTQSIRL